MIAGIAQYQSSLAMFLPTNQFEYTTEEVDSARQTMNLALPLVVAACASSPLFPIRSDPKSVLSLGPFGAQLTPAAEYSGLYPSPFGSKSNSTIAYSSQAFAAASSSYDPITETGDSEEDALTSFHLNRLRDFSSSEAFDGLSMYGFETVPNLNEARAIRRAMSVFESEREVKKAWYLSFVFPLDAETGLPRLPNAGLGATMDEIVMACFAGDELRPGGIGINCTNPSSLHDLIRSLAESLTLFTRTSGGEIWKPWLVLYPDGGAVYDVVSRTWSHPDGMDDRVWASKLADVIEMSRSLHSFDGIIAGGCCKAGPEAIVRLREQSERRGWILK